MNITMNNSLLLVNMNRLERNVKTTVASLPAGVVMLPVLKDDAYGLGLEAVAKRLDGLEGLGPFAVAHVSEGLTLRRAGISREVLVMGGLLQRQIPAAAEGDLTLAAGRLGLVPLLAGEGERNGRPIRVHVKLDTGLHRIGVEPGEELGQLIKELKAAGPWVAVEGCFTHFANLEDPAGTERQYRRYLEGVAQLEGAGIPVPLRHVSGSAAYEYYPQYRLDGVRIGRRMYLDHPTKPLGGIEEVFSWRTWVTNVKARKAGETLGYGGRFILDRDALVATIGVGYGDGLNEDLVRAHGPVLIRGKRCPLLACCMDQSFVDVTGVDCGPDEEVTLFGYDSRGNLLSSQEVSLLIGSNEGCGFTSALSSRVARVYLEGPEEKI